MSLGPSQSRDREAENQLAGEEPPEGAGGEQGGGKPLEGDVPEEQGGAAQRQAGVSSHRCAGSAPGLPLQ